MSFAQKTRDDFTERLIAFRVDGVMETMSDGSVFIGQRTEEFQTNTNDVIICQTKDTRE